MSYLDEHANCKCTFPKAQENLPIGGCTASSMAYALHDQFSIEQALDDLKQNIYLTMCTPERILKNGTVTIVFWQDGTKTIVKPEPGATLDDYTAFTAALAKKMFGSNSKLKKVIRTHTEYQVKKGKCKDKLPNNDLKEGEHLEAVPTSGSST